MARIRSVHPGLFTDEAFASLSDAAQIFWIGLWTEADDRGAFEWKPVQLKMRLRAASTISVDPLLDELEAAGCVQRYSVGCRPYGAVRNFCRWQRPKKPNPIHPLPVSLHDFVGLTRESSDESGTDPSEIEVEVVPVPPKAELSHDESGLVPPKAEISVQMEDVGCRREDGEEDGKKVASLRSADARGTRIPDDWWPDDEDATFAVNLGLDPHRVAVEFIDYWRGRAGKEGRKADWPATWRNRCRELADRAVNRSRGVTRLDPKEGRRANAFPGMFQ